MKIRILLLAMCALFVLPLSMDAQVTNYLKKKGKRAKKTATKTADKEVDKEIDKKVKKGVLNLKNRLLGADKDTEKTDTEKTVTQNQQGQDQNAGAQKNAGVQENAESAADNSDKVNVKRKRSGGGLGALSALMGGGGDVAHKDSYKFSGSIIMEMEVLNEDDGSVEMLMEYITYFNMKSNDVAIVMKPQSEGGAYQGEMTMIYDTDNNTMFMLTAQGGMKMAVASDLDDLTEDMDGEEGNENDNLDYKKTGKTKTIAGYKCDGYTVQDGESTIEMWVTKDMKFNLGKNKMKKAGIPLYYDGPFEGGMIMEMEMYEENIKKMRMIVKDVKSNINKSMSLDGYTIMNVDTGEEK